MLRSVPSIISSITDEFFGQEPAGRRFSLGSRATGGDSRAHALLEVGDLGRGEVTGGRFGGRGAIFVWL